MVGHVHGQDRSVSAHIHKDFHDSQGNHGKISKVLRLVI